MTKQKDIQHAVVEYLKRNDVQKPPKAKVEKIVLDLSRMRNNSKTNIQKKIGAQFGPRTNKKINAIDFGEAEYWLEKLAEVTKKKKKQNGL